MAILGTSRYEGQGPRTRGVRQGCVRTSTYDVKYHAKSGEISKLLFLQKVLDVSRSHFNSDMALC
jgi:hypothetical protein